MQVKSAKRLALSRRLVFGIADDPARRGDVNLDPRRARSSNGSMRLRFFVYTILWFLIVAVGDYVLVPDESGLMFSFFMLGFAAVMIFASKTFSHAGAMVKEGLYHSWRIRTLLNDTSLPGRLEARSWPPFIYALAGYCFLMFASFPLINQIVIRYMLKQEAVAP